MITCKSNCICFYSLSFWMWWVGGGSVARNWLSKRNGQPREPVGRNYFSPLSGM